MNKKCLKESGASTNGELSKQSKLVDQINTVEIDQLSHEDKETIFDLSNRVAQSLLKK